MWTYEKREHLTTKQALKKYRLAKTHPNDLVSLENLDCGHWAVRVYGTDAEKEAFLLNKFSEMLKAIASAFAR